MKEFQQSRDLPKNQNIKHEIYCIYKFFNLWSIIYIKIYGNFDIDALSEVNMKISLSNSNKFLMYFSNTKTEKWTDAIKSGFQSSL